jgi:hypothetical protein
VGVRVGLGHRGVEVDRVLVIVWVVAVS